MRLWIIGLMVIAALAVIGTAEADMVVDDDNGTWADYGTLTEALENASPGETIEVYAGTYDETVVVDLSVDIIGNGSADTIVDGNGGGTVFNVSGEDVTISGLNVTSGNFGIHLQWANNSVVSNCIITDNYRIGIYINWSTMVNVTGCNVSHNGDGVFIRNTTWTDVHDSSICKNMRGGGTWNDGIRFDSVVENVTLWGNDIYGNGYGVDLDDPYDNEHYWDIMIANNTIVGSEYNNIFVDHLNRSTFAGNLIDRAGSYGLSISASQWLEIDRNRIHRNTNYGIQSTDSNNITATNNSIFFNYGSGINIIRDDNWTIIYNEFLDNDDYAIRINSPKVSHVHHNNFAENNAGGVQGYNADHPSMWDDGSEGNFWDDWGGTGTYEMDGNANAEDRYPLMTPVNTDAPEVVPELGALVAVSVLALFAMAFRRRHIG